MTRTAELVIESLAAGGDGVGRSEGLVVFVPRSAPGDAGRVRIEKSGRFARARWETITRAGPARVEPGCVHYVADRCGGCQLQHIDYATQLTAKADIIRDALQRIGKRAVASPDVRPSGKQWRYRRKLTLALRRPTAGDVWTMGLHPYDAPGHVFDVRDCPITDGRVLDVWSQIRVAANLLPPVTELRGAVQLAAHGDSSGASFLLEGATTWGAYSEFFAAVPLLESLSWQPDGQRRRMLCSRAPVVSDSAGSTGPGARTLAAPALGPDAHNSHGTSANASFVQVNSAVASELQAHVVTLALAARPATVIDAYAGAGDTAAPIAATGARVTAIELDPDGARRGAARLSPPSRMVQGRVENVLAGELPADVVIVNPPRTGLHEEVTRTLAAGAGGSPRRLIYVSCNPATLARDLARLPQYRIASLLAFDMFPQTAHVETVCELVPNGA